MNTKIFTPNSNYRTKLHLLYTLLALGVLVASGLLALILSTDGDIGRAGAILFYSIVVGCVLVLWVIAMLLVRYYYRSLSYEIQDDEVIVHVGIWTKSVKHVPYRTVTNLTIQRDIFDRWFFNIGTLTIQTAGMSGMQGAEEALVGLPNVQEVYEIVVAELRRFRGAMAPTTTDVEQSPERLTEQTVTTQLHAILEEVRAIRESIDAT